MIRNNDKRERQRGSMADDGLLGVNCMVRMVIQQLGRLSSSIAMRWSG